MAVMVVLEESGVVVVVELIFSEGIYYEYDRFVDLDPRQFSLS